MLTIFTIVVCVVSYLLNITAFLTYFSYVLAFAILKAFLSKKLKDVFNIRKGVDWRTQRKGEGPVTLALLVQTKVKQEREEELLNGYVPTPPVKDFIVTPAVDNNGSATLGNYVLAKSLVK